jgi:hypothetical protein
MTDIRFACPACRQPLVAPADMAGDIIKCPKCSKNLIIPKSEFKKCPLCAEEIRVEAIKCKHCGGMLEQINEPPPPPPSFVAPRRPNVSKGEIMCPSCHYIGKPNQKTRGSVFVGLILCLFYVLPGIIYFIAMRGYKYTCPQCGIKIQK